MRWWGLRVAQELFSNHFSAKQRCKVDNGTYPSDPRIGIGFGSSSNPYQTGAEMLSLLRTQTEQLKWTAKRNKFMLKAFRGRMSFGMRGAQGPGPHF